MYAYRTLPGAQSWSSERRAMSIGIAKPTPSAVPDVLWICALMPITRPSASKSGPPELPRLIGASVWIAFETANPPDVRESIERPVAETTPTDRERLLAEGASDRGDRLAHDDPRRVAERDGLERGGRRA